jgi:hypothetical protein
MGRQRVCTATSESMEGLWYLPLSYPMFWVWFSYFQRFQFINSSMINTQQSVSGTPPAGQRPGMPWKLPNDGLRVASGFLSGWSLRCQHAAGLPTGQRLLDRGTFGTPIQVPHGNPQKCPQSM